MRMLLLLPLLGQGIEKVTLRTPPGARQPHLAVGPPVRARTAPGPCAYEADPPQPLPSEGCVYVVYGTKTAIHVSTSFDSGETFVGPKKVADVGSLALGLRRGPRIAISEHSIVITAIAGEKGGGRDGDLLAWGSKDEGANWHLIGRLNGIPGSAREGLHAMAAGPSGRLYCAWIDLANDLPRICGARSYDFGRTWEEQIVHAGPDRICPCCAPSVAIDSRGGVYVMWRAEVDGARDMIVARSDDFGGTFVGPARMGEGTWTIDACPMDGGAIDCAAGRLRTIWRRERGVFRSDRPGSERRLGEGEQPAIAAGVDGEYAAWLEWRGGPLLVLRPRSQELLRLDEEANDPVLATDPTSRTPVFLAWESGPIEAPRLVVARLQGSASASPK